MVHIKSKHGQENIALTPELVWCSGEVAPQLAQTPVAHQWVRYATRTLHGHSGTTAGMSQNILEDAPESSSNCSNTVTHVAMGRENPALIQGCEGGGKHHQDFLQTLGMIQAAWSHLATKISPPDPHHFPVFPPVPFPAAQASHREPRGTRAGDILQAGCLSAPSCHGGGVYCP